MFVLWFALKEGRAGICDPPPRPDRALRPVSAAQRSAGAEKHSRRTGFPQRPRRALLGPIDTVVDQLSPTCVHVSRNEFGMTGDPRAVTKERSEDSRVANE